MGDHVGKDDRVAEPGDGPRAFDRLRRIALIGDVCVFLIFAAIGRVSHHRGMAAAPLRIAGTAAPFIAGWLVGAWLFGAYGRQTLEGRRGLLVLAPSWLVGAGIGLAVRSILERRIVPVSFMLVTFLFNLTLLLVWRTLLLGTWSKLRP